MLRNGSTVALVGESSLLALNQEFKTCFELQNTYAKTAILD